MPTRRLLLVRHGETPCSAAQRYCGHHDPPLTERGRAQALALRTCFDAEQPVAAFASDLARATQTAALALPSVAPTTDPAWREIHLGDWDGHTHDEIGARWPDAHAAWCADRFRTPIPGGENGVALLARVTAALQRVRTVHPSGTVAIFTHGGPIAALRCHAADRPMAEFAWLLPELGELVVLER